MIIEHCEKCGGEQAWPEREGEYPWHAKLENPCQCEPSSADEDADSCRDYQAEFRDRQLAAQRLK